MTGVGIVVLAGEHDDLDLRRTRQQFADQLEAFVRAMRQGRQTQVHQRQLGRLVQLAQQAGGLLAGIRDVDLEILAQHEMQGIGNQRVVVNDQQAGFWLLHKLHKLVIF